MDEEQKKYYEEIKNKAYEAAKKSNYSKELVGERLGFFLGIEWI